MVTRGGGGEKFSFLVCYAFASETLTNTFIFDDCHPDVISLFYVIHNTETRTFPLLFLNRELVASLTKYGRSQATL